MGGLEADQSHGRDVRQGAQIGEHCFGGLPVEVEDDGAVEEPVEHGGGDGGVGVLEARLQAAIAGGQSGQ